MLNRTQSIIHSINHSLYQGISWSSGEAIEQLMRTVYSEAGVDPADLAYVEPHATATVSDVLELNALTDLCKDRETPLLIGSIKSNMGYPEAATGMT